MSVALLAWMMLLTYFSTYYVTYWPNSATQSYESILEETFAENLFEQISSLKNFKKLTRSLTILELKDAHNELMGLSRYYSSLTAYSQRFEELSIRKLRVIRALLFTNARYFNEDDQKTYFGFEKLILAEIKHIVFKRKRLRLIKQEARKEAPIFGSHRCKISESNEIECGTLTWSKKNPAKQHSTTGTQAVSQEAVKL